MCVEVCDNDVDFEVHIFQASLQQLTIPSGCLSLDVLSRAIAVANAEVEGQAESRTQRKSKKCGHYYKYAPK